MPEPPGLMSPEQRSGRGRYHDSFNGGDPDPVTTSAKGWVGQLSQQILSDAWWHAATAASPNLLA